MKKMLVFLILFLFLAPSVQAAECREDCQTIDECQRLIEECGDVLASFDQANLSNKQTLEEYKIQVNRFEGMISSANNQIANLEEKIIDQEADIEVQKILFASRVRRLYVHQRSFSPLTMFLAAENNSHFIRHMFYQQLIANEDKRAVEKLSSQLVDLKENKEKVEENKKWLANKKEESRNQVAFLEKEIAKTEDYLGVLSTTIKELSAKQEALLAARSGTFTTSVGNVPKSNIPCSGPPGSPSYCDPGSGNWFGGFSFGGYTHRRGMSQYGAKGRADAGQNYQQILKAYYGKEAVGKDTGGTISVAGQGDVEFDGYYLYGIAEMPSNWSIEALKAQAVAARTYAYRYKQEGKTICTTQACQVFRKDKADSPPSGWKQAVDETKGQIIEDVITYYSSTAGGYLTYPSGHWDTECGDNSCWPDQAWEVKAGTPWFYSAWYRDGYLSTSPGCNRSHPWLNEKEMADILNAWLVLDKQGNDDRILPITIGACSIGGVTGNPYTIDELTSKANEHGGAFTSVTSASVNYSNDGHTSTVSFDTNLGKVNISGSDFRRAFNLRAPGYISIRSPLFNVEKK